MIIQGLKSDQSQESYVHVLNFQFSLPIKCNQQSWVLFDETLKRKDWILRKHGFPKIHTEISNIPKFRPIIGTTGTSHCLVDKYLVSLSYPLTTKKFSPNVSFDAGNRIQASFFSCGIIIQQCVHQTNCWLNMKTNLSRSCNLNIWKTGLWKKLILNKCTKTTFSLNSMFYQQNDSVSMGFSLGSVFANIIMTELEDAVIN